MQYPFTDRSTGNISADWNLEIETGTFIRFLVLRLPTWMFLTLLSFFNICQENPSFWGVSVSYDGKERKGARKQTNVSVWFVLCYKQT